jgi:predicted Rossmann fold flavoprotein
LSHWDVIIVGAGAAGLMAAASAAESGRRVLLLEKNKKIGVKILMSGGTRCNITHHCDEREIVTAFGRQGRFLHSALAMLPPAAVVKKIEDQGVATKVESTGKVFPASNKAIDVRDALVDLAAKAGATILTEHAVVAIHKVASDSVAAVGGGTESESSGGSAFGVLTDRGEYRCHSLLITSGGKSYPGCGTTGDGYAWAEGFGHSIVDTVPALVPILNSCVWANDLKGVTIERAVVDVWQAEQRADPTAELSKSERKKLKAKSLVRREGSFLFTHWGFSGPSILDVSREVAKHPNRKSLELVCDFHPSVSLGQFEQELAAKKSQHGKQHSGNLLNELFPKRLAESLLVAAGVELQGKNAELSKHQLEAIIQQVKQCRFAINGTLGFEKAEVTAGGVSLKEVDSKTMQSKLAPGLFFAGEVLDLDGPIGGFNFQSAFCTGWLAGKHV